MLILLIIILRKNLNTNINNMYINLYKINNLNKNIIIKHILITVNNHTTYKIANKYNKIEIAKAKYIIFLL